MKFSLHIDTDKLSKGNEGRDIARILREVANKFQTNEHFNPSNLINGSWGFTEFTLRGKKVGSLELVKS